jgi:hypothetical protein
MSNYEQAKINLEDILSDTSNTSAEEIKKAFSVVQIALYLPLSQSINSAKSKSVNAEKLLLQEISLVNDFLEGKEIDTNNFIIADYRKGAGKILSDLDRYKSLITSIYRNLIRGIELEGDSFEHIFAFACTRALIEYIYTLNEMLIEYKESETEKRNEEKKIFANQEERIFNVKEFITQYHPEVNDIDKAVDELRSILTPGVENIAMWVDKSIKPPKPEKTFEEYFKNEKDASKVITALKTHNKIDGSETWIASKTEISALITTLIELEIGESNKTVLKNASSIAKQALGRAITVRFNYPGSSESYNYKSPTTIISEYKDRILPNSLFQ